MPRKAKQSDEKKEQTIPAQNVPEVRNVPAQQSIPPTIVEKPKRKGRFEKGSDAAREHMKKLRELKAQKKTVVVVS